MIKKTSKGNYVFPRLLEYKDLVHGVSTVSFGDMNFMRKENELNIKVFAEAVGIRYEKMHFMEQLHTKQVKEVKSEKKSIYKKVDSLITSKNIVISTKTADCVPLIFFDPVTRTIAVAHSGWVGTYKNIAANVISKLKKKKVNTNNIIVMIGPSIGACCYSIDKLRAKKFKSKYTATHSKFITLKNGKDYLDLATLIKYQLLEVGIKAENIESADICTNHSEDFYSYRKQASIGKTKVFLTSVGLI